jgi:hypothetical protein
VAEDADDAVRDGPSVDHVQGPCNVRSPQRHVGVVHSLEPVHGDHAQHVERRGRRLQSWARSTWPNHVSETGGSITTLAPRTVSTAMRMLDNVIDINFYTMPRSAPFEPAASAGRPWPDGLSGRASGYASALCLGRRRLLSPTESMEAISAFTRSRHRSISRPSAVAIRASRARCGRRGFCRSTPSSCSRTRVRRVEIDLAQRTA